MLELERAHQAVIDYAIGGRLKDVLMAHQFTHAHFYRLLRKDKVLLAAYRHAQEKRGDKLAGLLDL